MNPYAVRGRARDQLVIVAVEAVHGLGGASVVTNATPSPWFCFRDTNVIHFERNTQANKGQEAVFKLLQKLNIGHQCIIMTICFRNGMLLKSQMSNLTS